MRVIVHLTVQLLNLIVWLPALNAEGNSSTEIDGNVDNDGMLKIRWCGQVQFVLYKNGSPVHTAHTNDASLIFNGLLDPKHEVVFLVHGFHNGCDKEFITSTKQAYFESRPDVQVITVCYSIGEVFHVLFPWTRMCFESVAKEIKTAINRVNDEAKVKWENMTLIGHSFGGQIVGEVGNLLNGKLVWIVALDAVSLSFLANPSLTPLSAQNVIAVHTAGYPLGTTYPAGTVNFYVNGGKSQPGCGMLEDITGLCSHRRSFRLFKYAIRNETAYKAQRCGSYDSFKAGECQQNPTTFLSTRVTARGKYYMTTEGMPPYKQTRP